MRTLLTLVLVLAVAAAKESSGVTGAEIAAASAQRGAVALMRALAVPGPMVNRPGGQITRAEAQALLVTILEPMSPAARAAVTAEAGEPAKPPKPEPKPEKPAKDHPKANP